MMKPILTALAILLAAPAAWATNRPPINGVVNIPAAGATDRTQLTSVVASSCTIQAFNGNAGAVYVGGSTVTNASGANRGIRLLAGESLADVSVQNLNWIYVATDNANDDVAYVCN